MEKRAHRVNQVCSKYSDELKYEYRALNSLDKSEIFQTWKSEPDQYDHINNYMFCARGVWDTLYMTSIVKQSQLINYNYNNDTKEHLKEHLSKLAKITKEEFNEVIKGYKR